MKKIFIPLFFIFSCKLNSPEQENNEIINDSTTTINASSQNQDIHTTVIDSIYKRELNNFEPLDFYNAEKIDTFAFLKNLSNKYAFDEIGWAFRKQSDSGEILMFEKLKVYLNKDDVFLLLIRHPEGGTGTLPAQSVFVFDKNNKLLLFQDHCGLCKILKIFPNQPPFILTSEETGHGNGTHRLYMYKKDSLINILNTGDWDIHTIDRHEDITLYSPNYMNIQILDINIDGFNDLKFSTKLILECDGENPLSKKLVYNFLYDPASNVFNPAGDYSFENYYKLCK